MYGRTGGAVGLDWIVALPLLFLVGGMLVWFFVSTSHSNEIRRMREVVGSIEQSIFIVNSEHLVRNRLGDLQALENTNPMELLRSPLPENYLGEWGDRDSPPPPPRSWYYDYGRDALIYRVQYSNRFVSESQKDEAVFKLRFRFADKNMNGQFDPGQEKVYGIELTPTHAYQWLD